jgi:hypothetical protein
MNTTPTFSLRRCEGATEKEKNKQNRQFFTRGRRGGGLRHDKENKTRVEPDIIKYTSINWNKSPHII